MPVGDELVRAARAARARCRRRSRRRPRRRSRRPPALVTRQVHVSSSTAVVRRGQPRRAGARRGPSHRGDLQPAIVRTDRADDAVSVSAAPGRHWRRMAARRLTRRQATARAGRPAQGARGAALVHVEQLSRRAPGGTAAWPDWADPEVRAPRAAPPAGIGRPWAHQAEAAELAPGRASHVVVATGTASGKSLGYLLPALTDLVDGPRHRRARRHRALPVARPRRWPPTSCAPLQRARRCRAACAPRPTTATPRRRNATGSAQHASYVLTNPDMLHRALLPGHARWASFLRALRYVVIDECHTYRGVFGSHVAQVLRRLRRICARYGADPVFVLASATVADPARAGAAGSPACTSTRSPTTPRRAARLAFALWEPPLTRLAGEHGAPGPPHRHRRDRRPAGRPGRRGRRARWPSSAPGAARSWSRSIAQERLAEVDPALAGPGRRLPRRLPARGAPRPRARPARRRAARARRHQRAGARHRRLRPGRGAPRRLARAPAPRCGSRPAGPGARAGRAGASWSARDDPLDTYLVHHPEALFDQPVESTVLDPDNPYVLGPAPVRGRGRAPADRGRPAALRPGRAGRCSTQLDAAGLLRRRPAGWYWTRASGPPTSPTSAATAASRSRSSRRRPAGCSARSTQARPTPPSTTAPSTSTRARPTWSSALDLDDAVALVEPAEPAVLDARPRHHRHRRASTTASERLGRGRALLRLRRGHQPGRVLPAPPAASPARCSARPLDLPPRTLRTRAVWWTLSPRTSSTPPGSTRRTSPAPCTPPSTPSIGMLPLFATCDRWDIGGVSDRAAPGHRPADGLRLRRPPGRRGLRRAGLPHRPRPG